MALIVSVSASWPAGKGSQAGGLPGIVRKGGFTVNSGPSSPGEEKRRREWHINCN